MSVCKLSKLKRRCIELTSSPSPGVQYDIGGFRELCDNWRADNPPHPTHAQTFSTCAYLNRTQPSNAAPGLNASAFVYRSHDTGPIEAQWAYTPTRHAAKAVPWPPTGLRLSVHFSAPATAPQALKWVTVSVHYELLQGVPAMTKYVTVSAPAPGASAAPKLDEGHHDDDHAHPGHDHDHNHDHDNDHHASASAALLRAANDANDPGAVEVGNVVVETLRVNDDFAGVSYPIADAWVLGSQALLHVEPDIAYVRRARMQNEREREL